MLLRHRTALKPASGSPNRRCARSCLPDPSSEIRPGRAPKPFVWDHTVWAMARFVAKTHFSHDQLLDNRERGE
jgi:hypothetical protein